MSYARWSEGDAYVYPSVHGHLECMGCSLESTPEEPHKSFRTKKRSEMIAHIERHIAAGHVVPGRTLPRLRRELAKDGDRTDK